MSIVNMNIVPQSSRYNAEYVQILSNEARKLYYLYHNFMNVSNISSLRILLAKLKINSDHFFINNPQQIFS